MIYREAEGAMQGGGMTCPYIFTILWEGSMGHTGLSYQPPSRPFSLAALVQPHLQFLFVLSVLSVFYEPPSCLHCCPSPSPRYPAILSGA